MQAHLLPGPSQAPDPNLRLLASGTGRVSLLVRRQPVRLAVWPPRFLL